MFFYSVEAICVIIFYETFHSFLSFIVQWIKLHELSGNIKNDCRFEIVVEDMFMFVPRKEKNKSINLGIMSGDARMLCSHRFERKVKMCKYLIFLLCEFMSLFFQPLAENLVEVNGKRVVHEEYWLTKLLMWQATVPPTLPLTPLTIPTNPFSIRIPLNATEMFSKLVNVMWML